jgi:vancomycin permeability regulator SanA
MIHAANRPSCCWYNENMLRKALGMIFKIVFTLVLIGAAAIMLPRVLTALYALPRTYSVEAAPSRSVAVVFGAGLWRDGSPTPVLRDRVQTAAELYSAGKVQKLLMSGDNSTPFHNEPQAMREFALQLGVPDEAIVLDYAGRRTYDTCLRAKQIFGVTDVLLVTQSFHLPRAIFTCNVLGVNGVGVPADLRDYRRGSLLFWNLRELPATLTALWDLYVAPPSVVLGRPEPIFPENAQ